MVDLAEIQAAYYMVAATGVLVAAVYYIMNIKTTQKNMKTNLETRQAQLFMEIYRSSYSTDMMTHATNFWMEGWDGFEDWRDKIWLDKGKRASWGAWNNYYEGIGVLVKEGLVDIRLVAELIAGITRKFWEMHAPIISEIREYTDQPRMLSETEYLYNRLMKYMVEHPELKT
jgi:hypothetical protein